jgi:hypothetical protein
VTGKEFLFGYDTNGRPAMHLFLSRQNTEEGLGHIQLHVWLFERAIELMSPGVEYVFPSSLFTYLVADKRVYMRMFRTVAVLMEFGENGSPGTVGQSRRVREHSSSLGFQSARIYTYDFFEPRLSMFFRRTTLNVWARLSCRMRLSTSHFSTDLSNRSLTPTRATRSESAQT